MKPFWQNIQQFLRDEEGVTAIEYGLIAALIAVVIIAAVRFVGTQLQTTFSTVGNELQNSNTSTTTSTGSTSTGGSTTSTTSTGG